MKNALLLTMGLGLGLLFTPAEAQNAPAAERTMILGVGGSAPNQNDLFAVLTKVKPVAGPERTVLALYHADQGTALNLTAVRMIDADLRMFEYTGKRGSSVSVTEILKLLPKEERDALVPPR